MKKTKCILCGSDQTVEVFTTRDFRLNKKDRFYTYVNCQCCGLLFQDPQPTEEEMVEHYNVNDLYPMSNRKTGFTAQIKNLGLWKRSRIITQKKNKGTLLDIGCGDGSFLKYIANHSSLDVMGIEINQNNVDKLNATENFPVYSGDIRNLSLPESHFDVVTLWDVLEHVKDPKGLLQKVQTLVKPQGLLVLRVPNGDSLDFKIFGKYWAGVDAPRHYYIFTFKTLSKLLESAGFSIISKKCDIGSYLNFLISMRFWLRSTNMNPLHIEWILKIMGSILFRLILFPIFWLKDLVSQGTSLTITAKPISEN
jgi:2-polyprenyl-3-methyl-5-hydroxy-6-metoxy-1,4-benzoquinol methylase